MTALLALLLDAAFGEPKWIWSRIPHPAVLLGRLIGWCDARFNTGPNRRAKGIAVTIALVGLSLLIGSIIAQFGWVIEGIAAAILLAHRSLIEHVTAVATALQDSLEKGQSAVAMIVGRDTTEMTQNEVSRAAIESGAENFSDGVIAPLFWLLVGGLPGILAYKAINTADSMIGYRTPKHADFGWASARLDDALNFVPARLTAAMMLAAYGRWPWAEVAQDARLHRSPNAGWPEAALSRILNVALAGPRSYDGTRQDFPWVNASGRKDLPPATILNATQALWRVWTLTFGVCTLLLIF